MAKVIFTNQTSNIVTPPFRFSGRCQVDISGVLDGADVITYFKGADDEATPIRTCSWLSSEGDSFLPGMNADGGVNEVLERTLVFFEIKNAGGSTDINLTFYADWYDE